MSSSLDISRTSFAWLQTRGLCWFSLVDLSIADAITASVTTKLSKNKQVFSVILVSDALLNNNGIYNGFSTLSIIKQFSGFLINSCRQTKQSIAVIMW
jgi:hypothetical protein